MAHDFLGNELSVGDDVVFLNYNGTSASLERGKITRVSEHTAVTHSVLCRQTVAERDAEKGEFLCG